MKKISILALHLGFGGVEKAIVNLANMLSDKYKVEIVVVYKVDDDGAFNLNDNVKVLHLSNLKPNKKELKQVIKSFNLLGIFREGVMASKILYQRRNLIEKYIKTTDADVIISSRYLFHDLVGKYAKNGVIKIAQEHRHHNNDKKYISKLKKACKNIDYLMPVSQELANDYKNVFKSTNVKVKYIRHMVDSFPDKINYKNNGNLVVVSRLSSEKGVIDLVDVMNYVHKKNKKLQLHVFGDGDERKNIEKRIELLQLKDVVILHGFQKKDVIGKQFNKSSIFVLGSHEESFGLVLVEAMAYGIPCIAFTSAQGAHEIIDESNGFLIENRDLKQMAEKILDLYEDKEKLDFLSQGAIKTSLYYKYDVVQKEWFDFLESFL